MGWGQDGLGKCGMGSFGVLGISVRVDVAARRLVLGDGQGDRRGPGWGWDGAAALRGKAAWGNSGLKEDLGPWGKQLAGGGCGLLACKGHGPWLWHRRCRKAPLSGLERHLFLKPSISPTPTPFPGIGWSKVGLTTHGFARCACPPYRRTTGPRATSRACWGCCTTTTRCVGCYMKGKRGLYTYDF